MSDVRRTAMGSAIDMDILRLTNEDVIAIGNAKTNARGDLLGIGGAVVKTRAQIMAEYHKMHSPIASHDDVIYENASAALASDNDVEPVLVNSQSQAQDTPIAENASPGYTKPRGSFADSVAKQTEISQELMEPASLRDAPTGVQRI